MTRLLPLALLVSIFITCTESDPDDSNEPPIDPSYGNHWIELNLNIFPINVSQANAILTKGFDTLSVEFSLSGNQGRAELDSVLVGSWSLTVEILDNTNSIIYGAADSVDVVAAQFEPETIVLHRFTGSLDIVIIWGSNSEGIKFDSPDNYSTGTRPLAVIHTDYDLDQDLDLIVSDYSSFTTSLFVNDGYGDFYHQHTRDAGIHPADVLTADLDGTERPEVVFADYDLNTPGITVLSYNADLQTYLTSQFIVFNDGPSRLRAGDVDKDGDLDIITAIRNSGEFAVLKNDGSGFLEIDSIYTVGELTAATTLDDYDGDGDLDVAISQTDADKISIYLNDGTGTYFAGTHYTVQSYPWEMTSTDLDRDGDTDLIVVLRHTDQIQVLLNQGNGAFEKLEPLSTGSEPIYVAAGDLNNDGDMDFAVACLDGGVINAYVNSNNTYTLAYTKTLEQGLRAISLGDLDGDQMNDVAVVNMNRNQLQVLTNLTGM